MKRDHRVAPGPALALALATLAWLAAGPGARGAVAAEKPAAEEKRQVPKPEEKKRRAEEAEKRKTAEDEEDAWWGDCFFDCLSSLLFSRREAAPPEGIGTPHDSRGVAHAPWRAGGRGVVLPRDTLAYDVDLWDGPGGAGAGFAPVGRLRIGAEVQVIGTRSLPSGLWLEVTTGDPGAPSGWVAATEVVPRAAEPGPAAPPGERRVHPAAGPPHGVTIATLSGSWVGPRQLRDEYESGGFAAGLRHLWVAGGGFAFGPALEYSIARGTPRFDYVTPTRRDSPTRSTIQILGAAARAGHHVAIGAGGAAFDYGLGPTLDWVRQSSDMRYADLSPVDSSVVATGTRVEKLDRWRVGADVTLGVSTRVAGDLRLGVAARGFAIPWRSESTKSLSADFIGRKTLLGFEAGVTIGHDWR